MLSRKRKILAIHERIAVLDKIKEGHSCRSIAEDLGVVRHKFKELREQKEH